MKVPRLSPPKFCLLSCAGLLALNIVVHFPYATDPQTASAGGGRTLQKFYEKAYAAPAALSKEEQDKEALYVRIAERAAESYNVRGIIRRFVDTYHLQDKRVLDVGAGRGYLQDMVEDYTGLDISPTAGRYFHKPFVEASATSMPFGDGEFDAIWTVWVIEHIPNPESALREMRRVVKPGGLILLAPAWLCRPWAADGYEVRPFGDFGLGGKLIKASIPIRSSPLFEALYVLPVRFLRYASAGIGRGPTQFHYRRLRPNYEKYWVPDSDAVNSMDSYEAALWFTSRGDKCVDCPEGLRDYSADFAPLIIQVKPDGSGASQPR